MPGGHALSQHGGAAGPAGGAAAATIQPRPQGIAASIIAVEAILAEGLRFPGAIEISGTVDEETGGYAGVAWLAERGYFSPPRVHHVIIPEPLQVDRVCLGHRGVWWAELELRGRIAHGSMPFLGVSAIRGMGRFLDLVERELYPKLDARRTRMPVMPHPRPTVPVSRGSTSSSLSAVGVAHQLGDGIGGAHRGRAH